MRIWRSTSRRLAEQALVLWILVLGLEHTQQDARIRAKPLELLGVVQAESGQSLKSCGNSDNELIWIARGDFSTRLSLDDEVP